MSNYVKPQSPIYNKKTDTYIYPLTTADQVIMPDGSRFTNIGVIQKNYSVVGGLEEPSNPTQNMIWVQTETSIGRVFFGNDEPNETFMEGDIWIRTGNSGNVAFNSLKIDNAYINMVYPLRSKQMVSGVLVDAEAMSYQNGEWVKWVTYLYKEGDQCENVTGGWERKAYGGSTTGSVSLEQSSLKIVSGIEATVCCGSKDFDPNSLKTKNKISCIVDCSVGSGTTTVKVGVVPDYDLGTSGIDSKWICSATATITGIHEISVEFPLGTIGYPMISAYNATANYSKIWIE